MQEKLLNSIVSASNLPPETVSKVLLRSNDIKNGDFAFPCFLLAKEWKVSPPDAAARLKAAIALPEGFSKCENVGPYLNFFLDRADFTKTLIQKIITDGYQAGSKKSNGKTIVIDYSGPNIAKNLNVAHMRTTLIGLSLYRIFKHQGYKTVGINHLGDWGVQFGYIWAGCELWGMPKELSIDSLVEIYVKASSIKKMQEEEKVPDEYKDLPDLAEMAKNYFIRLEEKDPEATKFWQGILDLSIGEFNKIYNRLGIEFDYQTGESFYGDQIPEVEDKIKKSGILEDSKGALGVDLGKALGFARIFAADGRSLYITRDLAAAIYRDKTFTPEKILYVVAAQQSLHFNQMIEILKRMKEPCADKVVHVSFGFVPGMRTRGGTVITMKDFLDEAYSRALETYQKEVTKRPEGLDEKAVAESVAIGATYFYFLKHTNIKDFNFSWEEALNLQGDTGVYVQYSLARIFSIIRKASDSGLKFEEKELLEFNAEHLKEESCHELVALLSRFENMVEKAVQDYEPSHIAVHLLDISKSLSKNYKSLRVVGEEKEVAKARLALFTAAKNVLYTGLQLIGVPPIEQM